MRTYFQSISIISTIDEFSLASSGFLEHALFGEELERHMEPETAGYALSRRILEFSSKVIGCYIIRVSDGIVIGDVVRDEYQSKIKPFSRAGGGMSPKWGLAGMNASKRMDDDRGRTLYLVAARESFVTLLFLHPRDENLEIGIMLTPDIEPSRVYKLAMDELSEN